MDITAERQRLENEQRAIEQYLSHPITREILADNQNEQEKAIRLLTNQPIDSIEAFFNHFEAVGHLRGLRRSRSIIDDSIEDIKDQLENLPNE
jgi:hypothetical protein